MNIDNRKTALDDDSLLYQKRDDTLGKKDTSDLNVRQKAGYFKDYYLVKILIAAALIAAAAYLVYSVTWGHTETVFTVAALDDAQLSDTDGLGASLRESLEITEEKELVDVSNYDLTDYTVQMKFTTLAAAQSIDVVLCTEEDFITYSGYGYFADLSEVLPSDLYAALSDHIVTSSETETDAEGNVTETMPAAPHGIVLTDSALYKEFGGNAETLYVGILGTSEHLENAISFIRLLTGESAS